MNALIAIVVGVLVVGIAILGAWLCAMNRVLRELEKDRDE